MRGTVEPAHKNVETKRTGSDGKSYYVYLILCDDGSYYTGYTNDVASRFERHKKGYGARYTRLRRPEKVVYVEEFNSRGAAIRRELQIKLLSHREKRKLVSGGSHNRIELVD